MKKLLVSLFLLISIQSFGQCTFERINQSYTIETDYDRSISLYDESIGFVSVIRVFKDTLFFPDGNRMLLIYQTDSCGNQRWDVQDDEVLAGADYASVKNNIVKDNEGNYYVISTDGGRIQSLATKYSKTGQQLKQVYLSKSSLPLHRTGNIKTYPLDQNRFIIYGYTEPGLIWPEKPLIMIIDENLNIINQKIFQYSEYSNISSSDVGTVMDLYFTNSNYFYGHFYGNNGGASFGGNFLVKLDTNLNIINSIAFEKDTVKEYRPYYTHFNADKNEFNCYGRLELTTENRGKMAFWKADTNGRITYLKNHDTKTEYPVFSMSPTSDGGFICGPNLLKLDSNFNVQWYKPTKGTLTSITQLPDGGYVGSGVSDALTKTWGDTNVVRYYQPYLIRTDKNGNYAPLSLPESAQQQLNNNISIYPNPAKENVAVQLPTEGIYQVSIYDALGKQIYQQQHNGKQQLSVAQYEAGVYFVKINNASGETIYNNRLLIVK